MAGEKSRVDVHFVHFWIFARRLPAVSGRTCIGVQCPGFPGLCTTCSDRRRRACGTLRSRSDQPETWYMYEDRNRGDRNVRSPCCGDAPHMEETAATAGEEHAYREEPSRQLQPEQRIRRTNVSCYDKS